MDPDKSLKIKALLYWYILGVPLCLVFFAWIQTVINFPVLIGFAFLAIILYAGFVGIMIIFTNATLQLLKELVKKKD